MIAASVDASREKRAQKKEKKKKDVEVIVPRGPPPPTIHHPPTNHQPPSTATNTTKLMSRSLYFRGGLPQQAANSTRGIQPLFDVEIARGLVEHVDVGLLDADDCAREALQLAAGQVGNAPVQDLPELQPLDDEILVVELLLLCHDRAHGALDNPREAVDVPE